ncbi:protein phosphatase 2C domain-containing protein [Streptomyces sp. NPDC058872]|uniref:protein phosphatase 2C domain-containing protein n=1 Tax=Streptomyces sp. NPDC058872 TaxID=3346661 RepID=UPI0036945596
MTEHENRAEAVPVHGPAREGTPPPVAPAAEPTAPPATAAEPRDAPAARHTAPSGPAGDSRPPTLGPPAHSGAKPPLYPSVPQGRPWVSDGNAAASIVPDTVLDGASHGALTVRAASVRGDAHRYLGEPRQDSTAVAFVGEPATGRLMVLAVADGVGSQRLSHVGSTQACRIAVWTLALHAGEVHDALAAGREDRFAEVAEQTVERVATRLLHRAQKSDTDPLAYSTTLRVLLVPLDPEVRARGLITVGDGGTALLRDGTWDLAPGGAARESGDGVIDTRTAALPATRTASARLLTTRPGDVLVLSTDGLSTPLAGEPSMREFLGAAWSGGAPEPADFLWQFQYRVKSYDDDRTAAVLWEART